MGKFTQEFKFNFAKLFTEKDLIITEQVKIDSIPTEIRLPYLGYFKDGRQQWTLTAIGGSGSFKWQSSNLDIASVLPESKEQLGTV